MRTTHSLLLAVTIIVSFSSCKREEQSGKIDPPVDVPTTVENESNSTKPREENVNTPEWNMLLPSADHALKEGDRVFMVTNVPEDPFCGVYVIGEDGKVLPKYCEERVMIGGMSEIDASDVVLNHVDKEQVYVAKNIVLRVVSVDRYLLSKSK